MIQPEVSDVCGHAETSARIPLSQIFQCHLPISGLLPAQQGEGEEDGVRIRFVLQFYLNVSHSPHSHLFKIIFFIIHLFRIPVFLLLWLV